MIRSFSYRDFLSLESLVEKKRQAGETVSVVIPVLNEETTVGGVIDCVLGGLGGETGLVDEVVVIDGGSRDTTMDIARARGAAVYRAAEILPHGGYPEGKGTSLWKSQFVTSGDILVFLDADVVAFESKFVCGLLGALLADRTICFTKACYRRPLVVDGTTIENYGGRVTEILARPLLAAWYPELARLRQPLSGEYAFRRSVVEHLSFCCGYGVEIRLILGMYRQFGLQHMAEVDMGTRVHRNRPGEELGKMSFAILQAFRTFLREEGRISWGEEPCQTMLSPHEGGWDEETILEPVLPSAAALRNRGAND
jgi:glucosyl-3-phosphoglycerate synthase